MISKILKFVLGYEFLTAGFHKMTGETAFNATGFLKKAVTSSVSKMGRIPHRAWSYPRFHRGGIRILVTEDLQDFEEDTEEDFPLANIKRIDLKRVGIQEAILQMNLLDYTFHAFINAETNHTEVVYKRNDGTYGLIRTAM